jgi:hypothetical protein
MLVNLVQFLLGQGDVDAHRLARLLDAYEKRHAVLEAQVTQHLIEGGWIRHGFAPRTHDPDVAGQGLSRHIFRLVERPTRRDAPRKSRKLTPNRYSAPCERLRCNPWPLSR